MSKNWAFEQIHQFTICCSIKEFCESFFSNFVFFFSTNFSILISFLVHDEFAFLIISLVFIHNCGYFCTHFIDVDLLKYIFVVWSRSRSSILFRCSLNKSSIFELLFTCYDSFSQKFWFRTIALCLCVLILLYYLVEVNIFSSTVFYSHTRSA